MQTVSPSMIAHFLLKAGELENLYIAKPRIPGVNLMEAKKELQG